MRLLVLSSVRPSYLHARAGYTVLASVLEALSRLGHEVAYATAGSANRTDPETESRLRNAGVVCIGDFTSDLTDRRLALSTWARKIHTLRMAFLPQPDDDEPSFSRPAESAAKLLAWRPDVVLLFWDTWFEHLLPHLHGVPVLAYLAKARHDSPMRTLEGRTGGTMAIARDGLSYRILRHQRARHFARLRHLLAASNICALDARQYRDAGIPCAYIPNTWPDAFGPDWRRRRDAAQAARGGFGILGNIGDLGGTGNRFGLEYLGAQVLPHMAPGDWSIDLCGKGSLPPEISASLASPKVVVKGFVDDIDQEVLSHQVLLLLNNAGPYTGGYTRVVYAFSAGSCLVAHRKLAESMPEVRHGDNALLGENGEEIASLLGQVAASPALAASLGANARRTYEQEFAPLVVARELVDMAGAA